MPTGDIFGLIGLAAVLVGGLIHLHVSLAVVRNDVRWVKAALSTHGLLPRVEPEINGD